MNKSAWCLFLLIIPTVVLADYEGRVTAIESFAGGGGSVFVFAANSPDRMMFTSSSAVVQGALLRAFMTGAKVKVITEGTSPIIRRVEAFEPGNDIAVKLYGDYRLNRIATQRTKDGDYLEVFLIKGNNPEAQFLFFEPTLQAVFFAAFETKKPVGFPLQIKYDGQTVVSVRIGER